MPTLTVRNVKPEVRDRLRVAAATHGRSMEAEVRWILEHHMKEHAPPGEVVRGIHAIFAEIGGSNDIVLPKREHLPDPISFDS